MNENNKEQTITFSEETEKELKKRKKLIITIIIECIIIVALVVLIILGKSRINNEASCPLGDDINYNGGDIYE